jgi:acyl-CoA thioesterase-1
MQTRSVVLKIVILLFITVSSYSQDYHVRIGFIGNSITIGAGLPNPTVQCYPAQLGLMLKEIYGDTCIITNYAVSGRTMLKKGDFPIWNEPDFTRMWNYAPDICFISLGTNDSKPYNWDDNHQEFFSDYKAMIDTFITRNPATKFIVCLPPPAFDVVWDIRNPVIIDEIIPLIDSIAKTTGVDLVDFYHPLLDSVYLFPDKIHPNAAGSKVMAKIAFDEIVGSGIIHKIQTGHSFVTSIKSNVNGELRIKDKATISWTTINTDEAFLNGVKVDLNGSLAVFPEETTKYTLVAKSDLTSDSLTLEQKVYIPNLAKFTISTAIRTMNQRDTLKLKLLFYDQKNKSITDSVFNINWSLSEGYGRFVNQGNNTVGFVGDSAGISKIVCTINGVTSTVSITVKAVLTSSGLTLYDDFKIYPNPFNKQININVAVQKPGRLTLRIFDTNGRLLKNETRNIETTGNESIAINTSKLSKGIYMYKLELPGKNYSGKIIKE